MREDWTERLNEKMADYSESVNPDLWPVILHRAKAFRFSWRLAAGLTVAAAMAAVFFFRQDFAQTNLPAGRPVRQSITQNLQPIKVELSDLPTSPVRHLSKRITDGFCTDLPVLSEPPAGEPEQIAAEDEITCETVLQKKEPPRKEEGQPWIIPQESFGKEASFRLRASAHIRVSPYGTTSSSPSSSFYPGKQYPLPTPGGKEPEDTPPPDGSGGNPPDVSEDPPPEEGGGNGGDENTTKASMFPLAMSSDNVGDVDAPPTLHRFPLQVGVRISVDINRKLALETGLTYMGFYSQTGTEVQRLHYLGIPLQLDCTILDTDRFKGYLLAGGEAFRCVAGNGPDKPWLFSWDIGAGIMYQFSRSVGIYVEPGFSRYYHTGVSEHYYTEHPSSFSLTAGVRFKLN